MKRVANLKDQQGMGILTLLMVILLAGVLCVVAFLYINSQRLPNFEQAPAPVAVQPTTPQMAQPTVDLDTPVPISSYKDAVNRAAKSVVNIYTTKNIASHPYVNDPVLREFFEYYGEQSDEQGSSLGSGVIVSKQGHILTNAHVIKQADEIVVVLNDGRKSRATVIGRDEDSDLAVIKVQMDNLEPIEFRSSPIEVGDVALAIGNPFGVGQTVTQGIISATGRAGLGVSSFEDFIQTDAAINPGNSGGALVDAYGNLVGINTVIYSRSGGSMGIGFAIPNSIVTQVMNALIEHGKVSRGWLGVGIAAPSATQPTADDLQVSQGVLIGRVWQGTPADKAGLQAGDRIVSLDGVQTNDPNTLTGIIAQHAPHSTLKAQILRQGKLMNVEVVLAERPSQP